MTEGWLRALGGLGLFLIGMIVMTDGLRAVAGGALRRTLARFTKSPVSGAVAGAGSTALLQSSSATTVAAVGFVGAGLLTFPQALGIVFGANLGTTITGWLVAVLGFKLQLETLVMPLVLLGAVLSLFGKRRLAALGLALAGFGLVFVGIAQLQQGLQGLEGVVTPTDFPGDSTLGRLQLVGLGVLLTLVTQSSSAGVATAIAAVHGGAIHLPQAAAMVIGMDVGTTCTAALATVGASTAARRTGWAHVIYNLLTGLAAFLILPLYVLTWERFGASTLQSDPELVLVAFHSLFNGLGVLAVLPVTHTFARLVERLIPERVSPFARRLDRRLIAEPAAALDALSGVLATLSAETLSLLESLVHPGRGEAGPQHIEQEIQSGLAETRLYLTRLRTSFDDREVYARQISALHVVDQTERLLNRLREYPRWKVVRQEPELHSAASSVWTAFRVAILELRGGPRVLREDPLQVVSSRLMEDHERQREDFLARAAAGGMSASRAMACVDAQRTVQRTAYHAWRMAHHLLKVATPAGGEPAPEEELASQQEAEPPP